jgi:hypothetical protein
MPVRDDGTYLEREIAADFGYESLFKRAIPR